MHSVTRVVALGLVLALSMPATGSADANPKILELDYVFAPDPVTVPMGRTLTWWNQTTIEHTTTDQSALQLWDSGIMPKRTTFSWTVTAAGTYPYSCLLHERFGMFGTLRVPAQATPPSGPAGTIFTVFAATVLAPSGMVYDIQKQDPGGAFQDWVSVSDVSASFDSTGQSRGIYRFRSRLRRLSDGATTEYSPVVAIRVTT